MYKSMVSGAKTASLFMGRPYVAGQQGELGGGLVETLSHDLGHAWVGNLTEEDMGIYYSAARDPIFYLHHSNLDRMWSLWKSLPNGGKEFADTAWLDYSFLFYNEKQVLIRIKVRDVLDAEKLGYLYQDVQLQWLEKRRQIKKFGGQPANDHADVKWAMDVFPRRLDKVIKVMVARPKKSSTRRSVEEKEGEEEVLVIEGIEANPEAFVKFDVLINYEDDLNSIYVDRTEYAGSFVRLRKKHRRRRNTGMSGDQMTKTSQMFGVSELLEDLGAEDDYRVQITLVPRSLSGNVFIGGIKIVVESRS